MVALPDTLLADYQRGVRPRILAEEYGYTLPALRSALRREGYPLRPLTAGEEDWLEQVRRLAGQTSRRELGFAAMARMSSPPVSKQAVHSRYHTLVRRKNALDRASQQV